MFRLIPLLNTDHGHEKMRFGFHISIAGGFSKVTERARKRGCETIQLFSRNPRGWAYTPLDKQEVNRFREEFSRAAIFPLFVHMPYLANMATNDRDLYAKSLDALQADLRRASSLGADYLIVHVGHRVRLSEDVAINRITGGINEAFQRIRNSVILLLENTAGQGTEVGHTFFQIRKIIRGVDEKERMGVCLDTAHAFAAGYDLSTLKGLEKTLEEFQEEIGLENLHLVHLNDTRSPLGSHVDRHWHIGEGNIGLEGFGNIINHPLMVHLPGIMETPRKDDVEDLRNMEVIRGLARNHGKPDKPAFL
ncbi:MAG: deoxyribonuclease IV [Syntrophobacterales bacterium]|nr:MAG: deoxyribonuclease IV [Syntrophobacterales bacterium]